MASDTTIRQQALALADQLGIDSAKRTEEVLTELEGRVLAGYVHPPCAPGMAERSSPPAAPGHSYTHDDHKRDYPQNAEGAERIANPS